MFRFSETEGFTVFKDFFSVENISIHFSLDLFLIKTKDEKIMYEVSPFEKCQFCIFLYTCFYCLERLGF